MNVPLSYAGYPDSYAATNSDTTAEAMEASALDIQVGNEPNVAADKPETKVGDPPRRKQILES